MESLRSAWTTRREEEDEEEEKGEEEKGEEEEGNGIFRQHLDSW